jgi:hypothetical protein
MGSVYSLGGTTSLGESWPNDASSSRSTLAGSTSPLVDGPEDIPALSKVEELEGSNPSEFQHVVTDAVTQLKVAAKQTSDPFASSFLWNLANRFQLALDSGDDSSSGSPLQGTAASTAAGGQVAG